MPTGLEMALKAVEMGMIRVASDGTVWRDHEVSNGKLVPITPRRAECRLKSGYLGVVVRWAGRQHCVLAHRLVWTVLKGPIPPETDVNHLNGAKANNAPVNLELASRSANLKHAYRTGLRTAPPQIPAPVLADVSSAAKELRSQGLSFSQIGKRLGISQTTAFRAVNA